MSAPLISGSEQQTPGMASVESSLGSSSARSGGARGRGHDGVGVDLGVGGPNIILRNTLGKVAANLRLMLELGDTCTSDVLLLDIFVDEGHRTGAYYLYKATCLVFYVCIKRAHALKIATEWLKAMNKSEAAVDVGQFDNADLFELLSDKTRSASKTLNQFTDPVPLLFDKLLDMPLLETKRQHLAAEFLREEGLAAIPEDEDDEGPLAFARAVDDDRSDMG